MVSSRQMTGWPIIVRHHFRPLSLGSWISLIIRIVTGSKWNHCGIMLVENGIVYVVEARGSGIVTATFDNWRAHRRHKTWRIGAPKEGTILPADMIYRIKTKFGKGYDTEALFIWHPIRLIFGRWLGGMSPKGKLTCSEFVGLCWAEYFPKNWYHLTTEDIVRSGKFNFDDLSLTLYFKDTPNFNTK